VSEYPELDVIMDGIRARDEEAFAVGYTRTADVLASFANGMVDDRGLAEDAVRQAFLVGPPQALLPPQAPLLHIGGRQRSGWSTLGEAVVHRDRW
jgi:hypothetical protein